MSVNFPIPNRALARVVEIAARLANAKRDFEEVYILDYFTGEMVYYNVGTEGTATIVGMRNKRLQVGNIVIHSHPTPWSTVCSPADIIADIQNCVWISVVVNNTGVTVVQYSPILFNREDIRNKIIADVEFIDDLYSSGHLKHAEQTDHMWRTLANDYSEWMTYYHSEFGALYY